MAVTRKALKLEGMDSLIRRLERLSGPRLNKMSDQMLGTGAGIVRKEARRRAPRRTGGLRSSIGMSKLKPKFGETAARKISARGKKGAHSNLVQLGTGDRYRGRTSIRTVRKRNRRSGRTRIVAFRSRAKSKKLGFTGRMPANPFMAEALRVAAPTAVKKMETRLRGLLIKELQAK